MSVSPVQVPVVETRIVYNVVYTDNTGDLIVKDFPTFDERNNFVKEIEQRGVTGIAVADLTVPGHL